MEEALLTPFECSKCHSQKCRVRTILPKYTEDHTVGVYIDCSDCETDIATISVTPECGEMLLDGERMTLEDELKEESN